MTDADFIAEAIRLSQESANAGGYPVGAVIVRGGKIIAKGLSNGKNLFDATCHAETAAIREAGATLQKRNLDDVVLYSSLEPCVMCFAASFWAHIPKVVFACGRSKVPANYYEGDHDILALNAKNLRKIELVHFQEREAGALGVITNWEKSRV